jgi:hypothetical protein
MLSLNSVSQINLQKDDSILQVTLLQEQQAAIWRNALKLPLTQIAATYRRKRHSLDTALHERAWNCNELSRAFPQSLPESILNLADNSLLGPELADADKVLSPSMEPWRASQQRYADFVRADAKAKELYEEMNLYRAVMLENLRPYGVLGFFFTPWLCPAAKGMELVFYGHSRMESARSFAAAQANPSTAVEGIRYKLQGRLFDSGNMLGPVSELSGIVGHERVFCKVLQSTDPDIVRFLLSLKPESLRSSFTRRA